MLITLAVAVGVSLLSTALTYALGDDVPTGAKDPWSGEPERFRPVDGDPIPIVFGTVDLAPAVVWSGEKEIRSSGVYGSVIDANRGGVTQSSNEIYALPVHWVIASGPVDNIREVHIKLENEIALTLEGEGDPGDYLGLASPGGQAVEGISVKWLPRGYSEDPDEFSIANSVEATVFPGLQETGLTGIDEPWGDVGFRHVTSMAGYIVASQSFFFRDGQLRGASNTFGSLRMRVSRTFVRSFGEAPWYTQAGDNTGTDMNPIHVIREVLTDKLWGPIQLDESDLDDASFKTAADMMHDEGIFVSALLSSPEDAREFLAHMFTLCNAAPYQEPTTGKYHIVIATDDYEAADLPTFDDSNSSGEMVRQFGKDMTTRMTIKYTKRHGAYGRRQSGDTGPWPPNVERTFSQTDPAGYHRYGEVELTHDYTEIHDKKMASKLATRDLLQTSRPLATLGLSTTWGVEEARDLRPGSPFVWGSDIAGIPPIVYRVTAIDFGSGASTDISVEAIEDAFSFPDALEPDPPETEWEDVRHDPEPATPRVAFQLPLWLWYQMDLETDPYAYIDDHKDDGFRPYGLAAGRPNPDSRSFDMHVDGLTRVSREPFSTFATPKNKTPQSATEIQFVGDGVNLDFGPGVQPVILADEELMVVTGWDSPTKTATVCRGWLDTVPKYSDISKDPVAVIGALYDDGTRFSRSYATDKRMVRGGTVEIKALTRTSTERLSPADAPTDVLDMGSTSGGKRSLLPLPPTYVRAQLSPLGGNISLSWFERDRLSPETECDKEPLDPKQIYEDVTYSLTISRIQQFNSVIVRTETNISDVEFTYSQAMQNADNVLNSDLIFTLWAVDPQGLESWQKYTIKFQR